MEWLDSKVSTLDLQIGENRFLPHKFLRACINTPWDIVNFGTCCIVW